MREFVFNIPPKAKEMGPNLTDSSDRFEELGVKTFVQGEWFIHFTTAAPQGPYVNRLV